MEEDQARRERPRTRGGQVRALLPTRSVIGCYCTFVKQFATIRRHKTPSGKVLVVVGKPVVAPASTCPLYVADCVANEHVLLSSEENGESTGSRGA